MKTAIETIRISERIRQNVGDLSELMESIRTVGLIHPIIINENNELVSGFRRLEACRRLGWTHVEVMQIPTHADAVRILDLEYHENIGRHRLSDEEKTRFRERRERLLHPPKKRPAWLVWILKIWQWLKQLFQSKTLSTKQTGQKREP